MDGRHTHTHHVLRRYTFITINVLHDNNNNNNNNINEDFYSASTTTCFTIVMHVQISKTSQVYTQSAIITIHEVNSIHS